MWNSSCLLWKQRTTVLFWVAESSFNPYILFMLQVSKIFWKTHSLLITVSSSIIFLSHKSILLLLSKIKKINEHQGITKYLCDIMFKKVYAQFNLRRQCIASNHRVSCNAMSSQMKMLTNNWLKILNKMIVEVMNFPTKKLHCKSFGENKVNILPWIQTMTAS